MTFNGVRACEGIGEQDEQTPAFKGNDYRQPKMASRTTWFCDSSGRIALFLFTNRDTIHLVRQLDDHVVVGIRRDDWAGKSIHEQFYRSRSSEAGHPYPICVRLHDGCLHLFIFPVAHEARNNQLGPIFHLLSDSSGTSDRRASA